MLFEKLAMTGFELRISGVTNDHSANCAIAIAQESVYVYFLLWEAMVVVTVEEAQSSTYHNSDRWKEMIMQKLAKKRLEKLHWNIISPPSIVYVVYLKLPKSYS